jgi:2,3-bisphosphoglycerate-independent phosphoglycerate mutase
MVMSAKKPVLLCILDGWGLNPVKENNAIAMAKTPNFDRLWNEYPHTTLRADGLAVGLPEGQFGNSEVGHMNIGAGRTVMQDLPRITLALEQGELAKNQVLLDYITKLKQSGGKAHLMGLISNGGVHAHQEHIVGVVKILSAHDVPVILHLFTDGRDTPPASAAKFVEKFLHDINECKNVSVGTVSGRFYAMDRDNRWERVSRAWEAITKGKGLTAPDALTAISQSYAISEQDEFIKPTVIGDYKGLQENDGLFMANFRADRAREILRALVQPDFNDFDRGDYKVPSLNLGMVEYSDDLNPFLTTVFATQNMSDLLGEIVSKAGKTQLRTAETEKYPHVTFFFNGGQETPYEGEERILVASPKVATYDLQPEMSAPELTDKLVAAIESQKFDLIVLNFANPDMVGHTGIIPAAIKAVETVDNSLGRIGDAINHVGGVLLVTADHGNADQMVDPITKEPYTAHTTNPVPFIVVGANDVAALNEIGKLGDIAPTILELLGITQPAAMTGTSLIVKG